MSPRDLDQERSIAVAHDYLLVMRGAERTFLEMARCWPGAPVTTLLYDEAATEGLFADWQVTASYLNRLGVGQAALPPALPALSPPRRARSGSLSACSSRAARPSPTGFAPPRFTSVTAIPPFRYAWFEDEALAQVPGPLRPLLRLTLSRKRSWDLRTSRR